MFNLFFTKHFLYIKLYLTAMSIAALTVTVAVDVVVESFLLMPQSQTLSVSLLNPLSFWPSQPLRRCGNDCNSRIKSNFVITFGTATAKINATTTGTKAVT